MKKRFHKFERWGRYFAIDNNNGNFFELDGIGYDAIDLLDGTSEGVAINRLGQKYGTKSAREVVERFRNLRKNGLISLDGTATLKLKLPVPKLFYLTLNLINDCNLRCRYCWNDSGLYSSDMKNIKMGKEVAFKAVDVLIKGSGNKKELVVDLYGGEPILNFNLVEQVIKYCKSREKDAKKEFHFLLATNGTLLSLEKAKFLDENGVDIAISIDGEEKIQDRMRPFASGKGTYDILMQNLDRIPNQIKKRMVARATFTPFNSKIVEIFKFLRKLGFERIEICETEDVCFGMKREKIKYFFKNKKDIKVLKKEYERLANFYVEEILKGSFNYYNIYFNRFFKMLARLYHQNKIWGCCSAGVGQIAVDAKGDIYPCTTFLDMKTFKIGNVFNGINSKRILLDSNITDSDKCQSCFAKVLCKGAGSCYNINYYFNKSIIEPVDAYCDIFRFKTKLMIAVIAEINEKKPHLLSNLLKVPS